MSNSFRNRNGHAPLRAGRGELIDVEFLVPFVLCALHVAGGELHKNQLVEAIEPQLSQHLSQADREIYTNGVVKWVNRLCSSKRKQYQRTGLLDPTAPKGLWRITPRGRATVGLWLDALCGATEPTSLS